MHICIAQPQLLWLHFSLLNSTVTGPAVVLLSELVRKAEEVC